MGPGRRERGLRIMGSVRTLAPLLCVLSCAVPCLAQAPPAPPAPPPEGAVRVVVVKGSGGQLGEKEEPELAPELAPWSEQLLKLDLRRYELLGRSEQRAAGPAAAPLRFELPVGHRLEASARAGQEEGKVRLVLEVTRPAPDPPAGAEPPRERVVAMEVELRPGQPCLVRCAGALPEADLLLLVSAGPPAR